jgi:C4-type Zn-finger protein
VYEVDTLKCPKCSGKMRIVSFIEEVAVIRKILQHCGIWKESPIRPAA